MRGIDLAKRDREPARAPYKAALFGLNQERKTSPQRRREHGGNAEKQTQYAFSALSQRTLRLRGESSSFHFPKFSYDVHALPCPRYPTLTAETQRSKHH